MKKLLILILLLTSLDLFSQNIPISNVRQNDSQGVSNLINQTITITGIITAGNEFGSSGPAYIQDSTAGVAIYGSGFASFMQIGDSVQLTAPVTNYNGLTELDFRADGTSFTKLGHSQVITPRIVTLDEIANQDWNGFEKYEALLVKVEGVTINESGQFEGNKNYQISDSTGTLEMRIDNSVSSIIGTSIPQSEFNLIGVVGQFDTQAPYNSGYQILPRSIEDLEITNEPMIINPVIASDITTESFTVYFSTVNEGDTRVKYGLTEQLELGEKYSPELVTQHSVLIDNLQKNTRYYYQVETSNASGTSTSDILSVTTLSGDTTTGKIYVYFNFSVDHSVAIPGNEAIGNVDFSQKVKERINSATYSIDLALYSFNLDDVANAIIAAKNRGIKVRFVYDARNIQSAVQLLLNAGIPMSQRPSNLDGIMHNKFMIIDARDNNPSNDWVWTGSWNWTTTELDWKNNVIEINNADLAKAYTTEFEEMWGSNTDTPNSSAAKFGSMKTDNTQHNFTISGIQVQLYFSPSDGTESRISSTMATADTSMYFAVYSFTSDPIFNSIYTSFSNGATDLRGIISNPNDNGSEYQNLLNLAPNEIFPYNLSGNLHHKYGLVDASYPSSSPTIITGSHNWSRAANSKNDENTLIITDIKIANQYMQEFKKRYNELGGTTEFHVPIITSISDENIITKDYLLYQNYPNPFNPTTKIKYSIAVGNTNVASPANVTLRIYDVLGREVATLVNERKEPGTYEVLFDAANLTSGIYFYKLTAGSFTDTKKMLLLK